MRILRVILRRRCDLGPLCPVRSIMMLPPSLLASSLSPVRMQVRNAATGWEEEKVWARANNAAARNVSVPRKHDGLLVLERAPLGAIRNGYWTRQGVACHSGHRRSCAFGAPEEFQNRIDCDSGKLACIFCLLLKNANAKFKLSKSSARCTRQFAGQQSHERCLI
jgi:hypothetical protein